MKRAILFVNFLLLLAFTQFICPVSAQEEGATTDEVLEKTLEAAAFLSEKGEAGLESFNDKDGKWVWKDSYIFVYNCGKGLIVAHPIKNHLIGKNLMGLRDVKGNLLFVQLCEAAEKESGEWIEYWWPKPGKDTPSRKISFMRKVPKTDFQVGAGIYNENISLEELNKSIIK